MRRTASVCGCALVLLGAVWLRAQVAPSESDPNGVAIPYPFVHLVHGDKWSLEGSTAWLRARDPFLLYQLGRDLTNRIYSRQEGAIGRPGDMSVALHAGTPGERPLAAREVRFARDHASSCGFCHSTPAREPGAGQTIPSTSSQGRNTTHFYGAGLIEMIGLQTRALLLEQADRDRNGWISAAEAWREPRAVLVPAPGEEPVDYGLLTPDEHGVPRLNSIFRVWYVDSLGRPVRDSPGLNDPRVAGFDFAMQPFGWGRGRRIHADGRATAEGGEAATLRGIFSLAADMHMGLQADDPSQSSETGLGLARLSLNGARQFDFGDARDRGTRRTEDGRSLDDLDGDGYLSELTEGDLDAIELYLLHAPAPSVRPEGDSERGRRVLRSTGCLRCHVESWRIEARDERRGLDGDRRLFHLAVSPYLDEEGLSRLEGRLVRTMKRTRRSIAPRGGPFAVERIYSDFKHWDLGPAFWERLYDGSLQREHRTAPLWGAGSSSPYGHDGRFETLDEVIRAHAGAAVAEREVYTALPDGERELLLQYLNSLVLYFTDEIPADIDGDGAAVDDFRVAGQIVGQERFDPRFLFGVTPRWRFQHDTRSPAGDLVRLGFITNVREAYRLNLPLRTDADADRFPDFPGHAETRRPR